MSSLKKIIEGEGIEITKEAIDFIIEKSDGSFRNLQRNFNEIYLQIGKKLSIEDVSGFYLGKSGSYREEDFDVDLNKGEVKVILEKLEKMAIDGVDFSIFRLNLMNFFQKKILSFYGIGSVKQDGLNLEKSEFLISLLVKASKLEKDIEIDQLPLELLVIEFIESKKTSVLVSKNISPDKQEYFVVEKKETLKEEKPVVAKVVVVEKESVKNIVREVEEIEKTVEKVEDLVSDVGCLELGKVEQNWGNLLMAIKPFNHSVEAFLRASKPKSIKGKILHLEVFYPFHKDRLEEAKNRKIVEDCLAKVFGTSLSLECTLSQNKTKPLVIKNDTPMKNVNEKLVDNKNNSASGGDIYDVAKEIFG
jgi:DNA polymerase III gamma/tau subunit